MTKTKDTCYEPNPANQKTYAELRKLHRRLHNSFGVCGYSDTLYDMMKKLLEIKQQTAAE